MARLRAYATALGAENVSARGGEGFWGYNLAALPAPPAECLARLPNRRPHAFTGTPADRGTEPAPRGARRRPCLHL
jgi:hypothetical protein